MARRKGQQDLLSAVLLTGIMVVVVGSVYFWGMPLVQKNKDVNSLQNSEDFMRLLNDKIKFVANNAGREQISINVPGIITFSPDTDKLQLELMTQGTIYSVGGSIPLSKVERCDPGNGAWGTDQPEVLCVESTKLAENSYKNIYSLSFRTLDREIAPGGPTKSYKINLTGTGGSAGQSHAIVIEYSGSEQSPTNANLLYTKVKITLL